jgi:hypothetical protein
MWMTILGFIGGPVIKGLIDAYQAKLKAGNVESKIAADLAAGEIAAQTAETQAITQLKIAQIGHPLEPEKIAMYITLAFYAKCVVWDTMLGLGTTNPLRGDVSVWAGMIMGFYFTKRGFENVARIIRR